MKGMGDLRAVADSIVQKLADGSLPVSNSTETSTSAKVEMSASPARPRPSTVERLTPARARRRELIKQMLLRYRMEKKLPPFSDDMLFDEVRWHDEHFTHADIPTDRLKDVYLEAMAGHGQYPLNVDDYLRAWQRVSERAYGHASDVVRGAGCQACGGTGRMWKFSPFDWRNPELGKQVEVDCIYGCRKVVELVTVAQRA
jgi:hypothetical protein